MFYRDGNKDFYHTRGNTGVFKIDFKGAADVEDLVAILSVKKKASDKSYLVQKLYDKKLGGFRFDKKDTNDIKAGNYVYDIRITWRKIVDGVMQDFVHTIGPHKYNILDAVTTD